MGGKTKKNAREVRRQGLKLWDRMRKGKRQKKAREIPRQGLKLWDRMRKEK